MTQKLWTHEGYRATGFKRGHQLKTIRRKETRVSFEVNFKSNLHPLPLGAGMRGYRNMPNLVFNCPNEKVKREDREEVRKYCMESSKTRDQEKGYVCYQFR